MERKKMDGAKMFLGLAIAIIVLSLQSVAAADNGAAQFPVSPFIASGQNNTPLGMVMEGWSEIPAVVYVDTPTIFLMCVLNTGNIETEYKVTITFLGMENDRDFKFESNWSSVLKPGETTNIDVIVTFPSEAVSVGRTEGHYIVNSTLDLRREDGERIGGLLETKEKYADEIMSREGVIGIGVGKEAIVVFVEEGKTVTPEIPAQLDGWPVVVIPTKPFVAW